MEKKVILSIVAIVLVACVLTGVTVAYFMDTEKSTGNVFAAGTLDLEVYSPAKWDSVAFNISNVKPGDTNSASPLNIEMKNIGSINGTKLSVKIDYVDAPGTTTAPETAVEPTDIGDLCKNVTLSLYDETVDPANLIISKPVTDTAWNGVAITGGIDAVSSRNFKAVYTVDQNAGNEIQGDICTFNISATLEQQ
ncbi:MAG: TasA family protein [Candidatus Paceibacterota bacterium]